MGEHIEVQEHKEVMEIKSRELQQESVEKLNNIIPVIKTIDNVNLNQIESNTNEIKNIVAQNLEEQPNIDEIVDGINKLNKSMSSMKSQITKLSKTMNELNKALEESNNEWLLC